MSEPTYSVVRGEYAAFPGDEEPGEGGVDTLDPTSLLSVPEIAVTRHSLEKDEGLDPRLAMLREPGGPQSATFRVLANRVESLEKAEVIVVSSARPGEGKTTCAANLAIALGECRRARVLLVEASVRRPQLATLFGFTPPRCFARELQEHVDDPAAGWSVVEVAPSRIHVAAADPRSELPQLVDAPAFSLAIARFRAAGYDYIIVDAPSVLGTAEVNLMQAAADGVIMVLRAGESIGRDVAAATEQLDPGTILGNVLMNR